MPVQSNVTAKTRNPADGATQQLINNMISNSRSLAAAFTSNYWDWSCRLANFI
jgi:hypothetical protein